jgi:asparagine synthase (glutamine-hydrolysing)
MTGFRCVLRPSGQRLNAEAAARSLESVQASRRPHTAVMQTPDFVASIDTTGGGPRVGFATFGSWIGVGFARLDNRDALEHEEYGRSLVEDLALATRHVAHLGTLGVERLLGDFAFALYNRATRELILARDAFGVRPLYYREGPDLVEVGSVARVLATSDEYDLEFVGEFLVNGRASPDRSVFARVTPVAPGHFATVRGGHVVQHCYWSVSAARATSRAPEADPVQRFRDVFTEAVRMRLDAPSTTWARLSGGLDSSSIVCVAQSLAERGVSGGGIQGTITTVDSLGAGDETAFARAVLSRYPVPNEVVRDYWMWYDDGERPPLTDTPTTMYPFFARDRHGAALIRRRGAGVMLCGMGADHYLTGPPCFLTDDLARGKIGQSLAGLADWSAAQRISFWKRVRNYMIVPFLPETIRVRWIKRRDRLPKWIDKTFATQWSLHDRLQSVQLMRSRPGERFNRMIELQMQGVGASIQREISGAGLDVRYPFLHRPLVELALALPPTMILRPEQSKWVLRQAMRGLVPDEVRTRTGKGVISARVRWSISHERQRVADLLDSPILADLGCVDVRALRHSIHRVQRGERPRSGALLAFLALETWLRVRSGRWKVSPATDVRAS